VSTQVRTRSRFYFGMTIALAVTVFIGFGPSFYVKPLLASAPARPLSTLLVVHGLVFTAWVILLVVQAGLVTRGFTRLHRQLGVAGAVLAALVVLLGTAAQLASVARDIRSGAYDTSPFLQNVAFGGFASLLVFAALAGTAIGLRRRSEAHKRLILLAAIAIVGAATARIGGIMQVALTGLRPMPLFGVVMTDLFLVALVVHDWLTARRVHWATLSGCLAILSMQALGNSSVPYSQTVKHLVHWLSR
jgi:hypothetical protein